MNTRTSGKVLRQSSSLVYGLTLIGAVPVLMKSFEDTFVALAAPWLGVIWGHSVRRLYNEW